MTKFLLAILTWALSATAFAQFRVEVSGVGMTQLPIAVASFRGNEALTQKVALIVQADLERSGQFRGVDASGAVLDESSRPDVAVWRKQGADALVVVTEWKQFRSPDFQKLREQLKDAAVFDGRNLYEPGEVEAAGLAYYGIGRGRSLHV